MTELAQDFPPTLITRTLAAGIDLFAGKWKLSILWYLEQRARRFSELAALLPGVTAKVLTYQLRDLVDAGLISRTESPGPRQTHYALTEFGRAAMPLLQLVSEWGNWHLRREAIVHCDSADAPSSSL
ncbi:MAG TPA: helix-turn-helix domain-containing protein [Thermoanaerobaculia bacterium]|nr:helix-turn-helix domain-containing protein [Thermoanaerobaculia bacterium]